MAKNQKRVLVLGAGYVSGPVVDYLTRDKSISVTVGKDQAALFSLQIKDIKFQSVSVCLHVTSTSY